ncbi:MAG: radical SAM protein, partial [Methanosarcinaceae archaeon]|nr:radical SAM protein [Methanosarcinaceae archaeon]
LHADGIEKYRKLRDELETEALKAGAFPDASVRLRSLTEVFLELPEARPSLLDLKIEILDRILEDCHCCERRCRINRKAGEKGFCRLTDLSRYSSEFLHMGEEPELVPSHTIFFSGCVFACVYCQNWEISTCPDCGVPIEPVALAKIIDARRREGAKNVNFVTPTPHPHTVLRVVRELSENTPVIWNSNMYHSREVGGLLEGVVDVYLADFKYGNDECARKYSKVKIYLEVMHENFKFACGTGEILLRHLVLPGHLECCTGPVVEWVAEHIPEVRFNLMFQYRPCYRALEYPEIGRGLTSEEQMRAIEIVREAGLEDLLV